MLKYISSNYYSECILLKIKDHNFILSPNKTIFWENKSILLVSDLHVGGHKAIPIPELIVNFNEAIKEFKFKELIILGDLYDAACVIDNRNIFKEFLKSLDLNIALILGNHDKLPVEEYLESGINKTYQELNLDMFTLTHKPALADQFNIHGHLHPGLQKRSLISKTRLSCFVVDENSICLPAFGGITGKSKYSPSKEKRIYTIKNGLISLS